jgi:hypothetical protein
MSDEGLRRAAQVMLDHHDALVSVPSGEPLNCTEAANLRAALAARSEPRGEGLREALAYIVLEHGETFLDDEAWVRIRALWPDGKTLAPYQMKDRLLAATPPVPALDVERLARALRAVASGDGRSHARGRLYPGKVTAEAIAREYAALAPERQE